MEAIAIAKYVRISPRKARQATKLIVGKQANEAVTLLKFVPKKSARLVGKVLSSAIANARQKRVNVTSRDLFIKSAYVDCGPSLKRLMPRSMGRANTIIKRSSHITVIVED